MVTSMRPSYSGLKPVSSPAGRRHRALRGSGQPGDDQHHGQDHEDQAGHTVHEHLAARRTVEPERQTAAQAETAVKTRKAASMKSSPSSMTCRATLPRSGTQNCGRKARKKSVTLGLVMFMNTPRRYRAPYPRKRLSCRWAMLAPARKGEPGQVKQVGRADEGQQAEGQGRGHEQARHAHGYYCCMEAQAGDEPQGGGHTGPHAVEGGLGEDEDDVRSRGKGPAGGR